MRSFSSSEGQGYGNSEQLWTWLSKLKTARTAVNRCLVSSGPKKKTQKKNGRFPERRMRWSDLPSRPSRRERAEWTSGCFFWFAESKLN